MELNILKNMKSETKIFYTFLAVHLIVWTLLGLVRTVLPTDALEGIYWGYLGDFGTPKHPPFFGWLAYWVYNIFKTDFSIYFVSQLFILCGFIYIYKLAKFFLNDFKAMLSVIILEGCWCYSYITCYYGFNPDVILLCFLPMIAYYFYKCMYFEKNSDWLKLGLLMGVAFLNKYQTAFMVVAMFIWALMFKRETFKNKFFYIAVIIALLIFSPHILWLIKYDFFPFMYFEGELTANSWLNHITAPLMFLVMQLALIAGTLLIFTITKFKYKLQFDFSSKDKKDLWFIILLGYLPLAIHLLMGLVNGGHMRPRWGYEFWFMLGITLFYFVKDKITKEQFVFITKCAYVVMFIIFLALGTLLSVEKNYRSRYPVAHVYNDLQKFWSAQTDKPLKYIGGYIEWTLPLTIYSEGHPDCILDTFGYKNPWISEEDLKKSGILIIDRTPEKVIRETHKSCPYLAEDYEINPIEYKFFVKNAFGQKREYTVYYFIVKSEM